MAPAWAGVWDFGIFLWFFGPLTVFPIVGRQSLDRSAEQCTALFGSLIGYIIYGFILGTIYASLDRIWVRLFIQSDPLVGGLLSIPVMAATGILPKIAGLDTSFGGISGLVTLRRQRTDKRRQIFRSFAVVHWRSLTGVCTPPQRCPRFRHRSLLHGY